MAARVRRDLPERAACREGRAGEAALPRLSRTLRSGDADTAAEARPTGPEAGEATGAPPLAPPPRAGQASLRAAPHQGELHLPRWRRLPGLEDPPPFGRRAHSSLPGSSGIRFWPRACSPGGSTAPAAFADRGVRRARRAWSRRASHRRARPRPWRSARRPRRSAPAYAPPTRCSGAGRRHWGSRAAAPD